MKLTIGTFDGVHLGHQAILKSVDQVVTFSNHPHSILRNEAPQALTTLAHKLKIFKAFGINSPLIIPFTQEFSQKSAATFLRELKQKIPFDHLILGHDAVLGRRREGTADHLFHLAQEMGFTLNYLDPISANNQIVSSSQIRQLIHKGDLKTAEALLGRPFSIFSTIEEGAGKGKAVGAATANINVNSLCTPPLGVYAIEAKLNQKSFYGIANLGMAPTIQKRNSPALETHLFDFNEKLYGEELEVIFLDFIRKEQHFTTVEQLQQQIKKDIYECKKRITSPSLTM